MKFAIGIHVNLQKGINDMENDFSDVCFGDTVFHIRYGWGIVKCVEGRTFRVKFTNTNHAEYFFFDGRTNVSDVNPSIFWDEIKIVPPAKPKRKVEKTIEGWINIYGIGSSTGAYLYTTKEEADRYASSSGNRLGEACRIVHKYTIEK